MGKTLSVVVGLLLFSCLAAAQDEDLSKVQIKVTKVSGNVYMLEGSGGNIGASVGEDGIVIVDDQFAPLADKIKAALKGITDKPVRFVINTHFHDDHSGGKRDLSTNSSRYCAGQCAEALAGRQPDGQLRRCSARGQASA